MKTEDIINHLKTQDSNIDFYKRKISELETQIENIKHINDLHNGIFLDLKKENYTKDEIITAYNKMLKYEGLERREGKLIINTMFEFLDGTHLSSLDKI